MTIPAADPRSPARRARDEQIAAEPPLPAPALSADAAPAPVEVHLGRRHRLRAVTGIVKDGLVHPLDPAEKLPEHARVIIVLSEPA